MEVKLKEIFVGLPKTVGSNNAENTMDLKWTSGIFKKRINKKIWLGKTNLEGDGQADLVHHGGPEKAVFAYPVEHYLYWQNKISNIEIESGGMGENLSITNQLENEVAIGDTYKIGEAIIQVSQPRQPCWKPARRYREMEFALQIQQSGRTGWYYRVLQEGFIESGQTFQLIKRPYPQWTVAKCNNIMHDSENIDEAKELLNCSLLAVNWQKTFKTWIETGIKPNINKRIYGPNKLHY